MRLGLHRREPDNAAAASLATGSPTPRVDPNPTVLDQAFTDPNPPVGVRVFYWVVVEN